MSLLNAKSKLCRNRKRGFYVCIDGEGGYMMNIIRIPSAVLMENAVGGLVNEIISRFLIKTPSVRIVGHITMVQMVSVWLDG